MGKFKILVKGALNLEAKSEKKLSNPLLNLECKLNGKIILQQKSKHKRKTIEPVFDLECEINEIDIQQVENIVLKFEMIHFDPLDSNLPLG
jgi:Ca2+-dependent lipid-binding protein